MSYDAILLFNLKNVIILLNLKNTISPSRKIYQVIPRKMSAPPHLQFFMNKKYIFILCVCVEIEIYFMFEVVTSEDSYKVVTKWEREKKFYI